MRKSADYLALIRQIWQRLQIPTPASARRISRDFFLIKSRSMAYWETPTALIFGQGCLQPGMIKSTYGTGSSIMMNIGEKPILSTHGVVTSLAWKIGGKVNYVLEGNLNYTGAVITWLRTIFRSFLLLERPVNWRKKPFRRTACIWFLHSAVLVLLTGTARRELLL